MNIAITSINSELKNIDVNARSAIYLLRDVNKENIGRGKRRARGEEIDEKLIECETFASRKEISIGTWSFEGERAWY